MAQPQPPAAAAIRVHDGLPKCFSGNATEDIESHLRKYDDYTVMQGIQAAAHDALKVQRFKLSLDGKARRWYDTQQFANYAALVAAFRNKYSQFGNTKEQLIAAWSGLQYSDNIDLEDFFQKALTLGQALNYPQAVIDDRVRQLLPPELQLSSRCLRLQRAIRQLIKYDKIKLHPKHLHS